MENVDYNYSTDGAVAVHESTDYGGYEQYEDDPNMVDANVYDTSLDKGKHKSLHLKLWGRLWHFCGFCFVNAFFLFSMGIYVRNLHY